MRNIISKIMTILVYLFLLLNALVVLGPVIWTVMSSLKPGNNLFSSGFTEISFTLEHYHNLLTGTPYLKWYKNTFILATCNMLISLVVVTITAFIFSRYRFKAKKNTHEHFSVTDVPGISFHDRNLYLIVKDESN